MIARPLTRRRGGVVFVLIALSVACGGDSQTSPSPPTSLTYLSLMSSPGDQIGNGFTQRVGLTEAVFSVRVDPIFSNKQSVSISVRPAGNGRGWWWDLRFTMPFGQPLQPGTYDGVRRWPGEGAQAGMDFSGSGAGCSALIGRFVISEVAMGANNTLDRLRMVFEQRCDSATVPIRGEISITANPWR